MTLLEVITSICRFVFMKREASLKVFERALQNNISKNPLVIVEFLINS